MNQLEQPVATKQTMKSSTHHAVVNLNTNHIHNHTVAQLYNSPLQQTPGKTWLLFDLR
jgi:hypothetical protein